MAKLAILGGDPVNPQGHVHWPQVNQRVRDYVNEVLDSGIFWATNAPQVTALEREWADYIGTKHALSVNSGTAALHMAVAAAGVQPGDEVITSSFTFVASALCALQHNAIPVFCDIDPRTFNMDPKKLEAKITEKTKAIIPVDIHGMPCDYDEINAIAKKYNLVVISDSCQSHGAMYKGKKLGSGALCDMSVFSLNGLKNLQSGDGGFLNTDSDEFRAKADQVRVFGEIVEEPRNYDSQGVGWCYRTLEFAAAHARAGLVTLDEENAVRQANGKLLTELLSDIPGLITPYVPEDRTTVYHYYRLRLDPKALGINMEINEFRTRIMRALLAEGVQNARWQTKPVQKQTLFQKQIGYGYGCPWTCKYSANGGGPAAPYSDDDCIETAKLLQDSFVLYDPLYPPNGADLMRRYSEAFHKVWDNMDEVLGFELDPNDPWLK